MTSHTATRRVLGDPGVGSRQAATPEAFGSVARRHCSCCRQCNHRGNGYVSHISPFASVPTAPGSHLWLISNGVFSTSQHSAYLTAEAGSLHTSVTATYTTMLVASLRHLSLIYRIRCHSSSQILQQASITARSSCASDRGSSHPMWSHR